MESETCDACMEDVLDKYGGQAWKVVGFTFRGDTYCPKCAVGLPAPEENVGEYSEERPYPVFLSDEFYWEDDEGTQQPHHCCWCGDEIE